MSSLALPVLPATAAEAARRPVPANMAVWILIWAELTEFALFFVVFLIVRAHQPEVFAAGPAKLYTLAGVVNTLALLTSSWFAARSLAAIRRNDSRAALRALWGTQAMAAVYLLVKTLEYRAMHLDGLDSRTDLFLTLYYYLTFNHLLHVLVGMCTLGWAMLRLRLGHFSAARHEGLEGALCYWHMVDLAWIIIFPLLYALR